MKNIEEVLKQENFAWVHFTLKLMIISKRLLIRTQNWFNPPIQSFHKDSMSSLLEQYFFLAFEMSVTSQGAGPPSRIDACSIQGMTLSMSVCHSLPQFENIRNHYFSLYDFRIINISIKLIINDDVIKLLASLDFFICVARIRICNSYLHESCKCDADFKFSFERRHCVLNCNGNCDVDGRTAKRVWTGVVKEIGWKFQV